jgi:hypothetical protein
VPLRALQDILVRRGKWLRPSAAQPAYHGIASSVLPEKSTFVENRLLSSAFGLKPKAYGSAAAAWT